MAASGWLTNRSAAGRGKAFVRVVVFVASALAVTAAACYDPMIEDGHLACADNQCPRGFHCAMGCQLCYHDTFPTAEECNIDVLLDGGTAGGSGQGAGGGGGHNGAGGGSVVSGGGATGTAGASGGGGAMVGSGGHGGMIVGGSGGTPGGAGGMNGTAGGMGTAGHVGTGGTIGTGGHAGAAGAMGAGGVTGAGGKIGTGGTIMGMGGAMMGMGGAMMGMGGAMMGMGGAPGLDLGSACSAGTQCASGFCVDKVCCNAPCSGQCQACDIAPEAGTCLLVASGPPHGTRAACGGTGVCGAQCAITSATTAACVFAPTSTSCAPQTCTGSTLTQAQFCNGLGTCSAAASGPCPLGLACNAAHTACLASCTTNADCTAAAPNCNPSTHQCTTAGAIGASCNVAGDCQNGLCVDHFCCNQACSGQCQACDVGGLEGLCTALNAGQPHGQRGACGAPSDPCGGQCNGSNAMGCTFPSGNACACAPPVSTPGMCNGAGSCLLLGLVCL